MKADGNPKSMQKNKKKRNDKYNFLFLIFFEDNWLFKAKIQECIMGSITYLELKLKRSKNSTRM